MKTIPLSKEKAGLTKLLRLSEGEEVVITRHGKPAGVLRGFAGEDGWFDYQLENGSRFLQRVKRARADFRAGKGVRIEEVRKKSKP